MTHGRLYAVHDDIYTDQLHNGRQSVCVSRHNTADLLQHHHELFVAHCHDVFVEQLAAAYDYIVVIDT